MSTMAGSHNEDRSRGNAVATLATTAQREGCRASLMKHDSLSIIAESLVTNGGHYLYVAGPGPDQVATGPDYCSALVSLH